MTEPRAVSPQTLAPDDLLRLSVGIEAAADLITDLETALDAAGPVMAIPPAAAGREAGA